MFISGWGTAFERTQKTPETVEVSGVSCGKQDLKLFLYDSRLSSMFPDRLISALSRFWTFLVFPIPSQTVRDFWGILAKQNRSGLRLVICCSHIPFYLSSSAEGYLFWKFPVFSDRMSYHRFQFLRSNFSGIAQVDFMVKPLICDIQRITLPFHIFMHQCDYLRFIIVRTDMHTLDT